jgi:hypothetical protein
MGSSLSFLVRVEVRSLNSVYPAFNGELAYVPDL